MIKFLSTTTLRSMVVKQQGIENRKMNLKTQKIGEFKVYFRNKEETERIKKEIFDFQEYKFSSPKIILL